MEELVFHIGLHKTGTTWLQRGLFIEHPDIHLVTDYRNPWDDAFLKYLIGTTDRKFNISHCRKILQKKLTDNQPDSKRIYLVSAERLSGHPYSGGYDTFKLSDRIHSCFPESRIIFTIRNQVDMILSVYKQLVQEGYRGTLSELIRSKHWKGVAFTLDMYEYDLIIEKYHSLFSSDRVLVLLYEDLKKDPVRFLQMITNFMDISPFVPSSLTNITHKSVKDFDIVIMRILNHFQKSELNPFPVLKLNQKPVKVLRYILALLPDRITILNKEDRNHIMEYFKKPNLRLKKFLNYDLSEYVY